VAQFQDFLPPEVFFAIAKGAGYPIRWQSGNNQRTSPTGENGGGNIWRISIEW
jgi:hypothetical protein